MTNNHSKILALTAVVVVLAFTVLPARAAVIEGASASAYAFRAHAALLGRDAVNVTPIPNVVVPGEGENLDEASDAVVGPIRFPEDGSIVSDLRVLSAEARRSQTGLRSAHGESVVEHLALFEREGVPLIEADLIRSVSKSECNADGSATVDAKGSRLTGLLINGQGFEAVPEPNTVIPLTHDGGTPADPSDDRAIRIVLNEQTGATRGTGLIVTMLHVIVYDAASSNVVFADLRFAQAQSSVYCDEATPPTNDNGDDRGVESDKVATSTTSDVNGATDGTAARAFRGDEVTWTITLTNNGEVGCGLVVVSDTLPRYFTFVKSSGDLTKGAEPRVEGRTVTWSNPARYALPAGGSLTETIVAKVADDAPYGTYTNLIDVEESTCSSFTQGLRGPVDVVPRPAVLGERVTAPGGLATTGSAAPYVAAIVGAGLLAFGGVALRLARA